MLSDADAPTSIRPKPCIPVKHGAAPVPSQPQATAVPTSFGKPLAPAGASSKATTSINAANPLATAPVYFLSRQQDRWIADPTSERDRARRVEALEEP